MLARHDVIQSIMGNLALHSAEEPDNLRATTGTIEVPTIRGNDAALALGARPIQQHEPAARHISKAYSIPRRKFGADLRKKVAYVTLQCPKMAMAICGAKTP